MTNKNLTFAFRFAAIANNSLFSNFSKIGAEIGRMEEESKKYTRTLDAVKNAFDRNTISAKSYSNAVLKLQSSMGKLKFNKYSMNMAKYGANAMQFKEMGNMIATPVKEAMDFQSAMNKVEALMNETPDVAEKNRAILEKLALQLGKELPYSAKEAADSMSFLAMAGWKTNNIVAGLPSLMKLAMAGGTDLARTADILSDDLTAFGLEADQSARMANVFATVITNTNTDVEKLGETMKYAAPVANAFGVSLEETAAMAGIMAGAGTKASQAGTSLRSGFLRLAGPPKKAREAMQELGMSMADISVEQKETEAALKSLGIEAGNVEGPKKMVIILSQLREKIGALKSKEEKMAITKAIFGTEASTGWLNLFNAKEGQFEELIAKLESSTQNGNLDKIAEKMTKGASGSAAQFSSAVNNLQIAMGTKLLPMFTNLANSATKFIDVLSKVNEEYPNLTNSLVVGTATVIGLGAAANGAMWAFSGLQLVWTGAKAAIDLLTASEKWNVGIKYAHLAANYALTLGAKVLTGVLWAQNMAVKVATLGFKALSVSVGLIQSATVKLFAVLMANPWIALATVAVGAAVMIWQNWDTVKQWFTTLWDNPSLALQQFVDGVKKMLGDAWNWIKEKWESISKLLSVPIFGKVNIAAEGAKGVTQEPAHNATGGIYGKGAFLTTFAEDSGESAIPHTPNARNIGLLAKTNEIMGSPLGGNNISVNFSPVINASGGADTVAIQNAIADERRRLETMLKDLMNQQRRLSYA